MENKNEVWRSVVGYEGLYRISNYGNVVGSRGVLGDSGHNVNYKTTRLRSVNSNRVFLTHRLVAIAFIPNPENKPCVNHINGIKSDNRAENLEWCTLSENTQHALNNGLIVPYKRTKQHIENNVKRLSDFWRGRKKTKEHNKKNSDSNKNKIVTEETKKKMRDAWKNRPPFSDATKEKMSKAQKIRHEKERNSKK